MCLPPGDLPLGDLIVGIELDGDVALESLHPIAMKGSVSMDAADAPVLTFELASLGCERVYPGTNWRMVFVPGSDTLGFTLSPGGNCGGYSGRRLRAVLDLRDTEPMHHATGLRRNVPLRGELRFTPSRPAALATRRLDHYLGNTVTRPIEITVVEVAGTWTDLERRLGVEAPPAR